MDNNPTGDARRTISLASGEYAIDRLLGRGGMAEVFLAHRMGPSGFSRKVVIKRILPALTRNPQFVQRFVREAAIAARLHHPNIVEILELEAVGANYCIVMEYLAGKNLETIQTRLNETDRPFPAWIAARVIADVAGALSFAHSHRTEAGERQTVIHRDISPDNVMITVAGHVKLLDFGVAKDMQSGALTQVGQVMGKPAYFCPEAARGETPTPAWDIYALGAVLYEVLCGQPPFAKEVRDLKHVAKLLKQIARQEPASPRSINPDVPVELEAITARAMAKDPEDRYPTAEALQQDLESFVSTRSRVATPSDLAALVTSLFPDLGVTPPTNVADLFAPEPETDLVPAARGLDTFKPVDPGPATNLVRPRLTIHPQPGPPPRSRARFSRIIYGVLLFLALGAGGLAAWLERWWADADTRAALRAAEPVRGPLLGATVDGAATGPNEGPKSPASRPVDNVSGTDDPARER